MIEAKLTPIERKVKRQLEEAGIRVLKGSFPDFIIQDKETEKYCLVEIKSKHDKESARQRETQKFLKRLNIPVVTVHEGSLSDFALLAAELRKVSGNLSKYLSKRERMIFDAMANWDTIKAAAHDLGMKPSTLYNWRSDLRKRYRNRRGWINAVLAQTKRGGKLTDLLHEKRKMKPPAEDFEE